MTTTEPRAYIAGPLFDEGERWWIEKVESLVASCGFVTFLPHRDNPPKDQFNVRAIFENDKRGIDECDVVVASLNGVITDDGTAWELGYAFATGKHIVGIHTDWLRAEDTYVIFDQQDGNKVYFKVLVKPLVNLLWIAGYLFLAGSLIAMWPDAREQRRLVARFSPARA